MSQAEKFFVSWPWKVRLTTDMPTWQLVAVTALTVVALLCQGTFLLVTTMAITKPATWQGWAVLTVVAIHFVTTAIVERIYVLPE